MEWLNYHHLLYFWAVAKEGSIARAGHQLRLAPPTISGQIHRLEHVLGEKLFARKGRNLVLTDVGRTAYRYADEIFSLGRELLDTVAGRATGQPIRVTVGVLDVLPSSLVRRVLEPAFGLGEPVSVVCREGRSLEGFLGELAVQAVDAVLSDAPAPPGTAVRAFNHLLGECGTTFFAAPPLARSLKRRFPRSLDGAPFLAPGEGAVMRRALEQWFGSKRVRPLVACELDDAALTDHLGEAGRGVFAAPDVVEADVRRRYRVEIVGRAPGLRQRFYAISVERKLKHPAVVAISEAARMDIFG